MFWGNKMGFKVDVGTYFGKTVMEDLINLRFTHGILPEFRTLERGNSIMACVHRSAVDTAEARRMDMAADGTERNRNLANWGLG